MLPAIEVNRLSKRYRIASSATKVAYGSLRDDLMRVARRAARFGRGEKKEEFWALRDVDFKIQPGEVVGIIGRNGAGKSTLLKLLSRVTEPTTGTIHYRGRLGSLLEVGTGFHPELTGRENIYLSGAILGMTRAEIKSRFDEIVDFSGVETFLETPVKRYSSGMQVRLGFAVAAHLEPEILIVDEVLAVGDAEFQKKCLGKMKTVANSGRTVLFVSHKMSAISQLCTTGLLLEKGRCLEFGDIETVVASYVKQLQSHGACGGQCQRSACASLNFQILSVSLTSPRGLVQADGIGTDEGLTIEIRAKVGRDSQSAYLFILFHNSFGEVVMHLDSRDGESPLRFQSLNENTVAKAFIPSPFLVPGEYSVSLFLMRTGGEVLDAMENAVELNIHENVSFLKKRKGYVLRYLEWQHREKQYAN